MEMRNGQQRLDGLEPPAGGKLGPFYRLRARAELL